MGNRITEIESPQGFAAEAASAAVILSSFYGYPLSTTHVVSGGVMGAGAGRKLLPSSIPQPCGRSSPPHWPAARGAPSP